jgi:DNA segregation ATPase FtsK/SpoIIIE-like protein
MEARYRIMRELGVRNIDSYNQIILSGQPLRGAKLAKNVGNGGQESDTPTPPRLPKIIIVIDELADLLLSQARRSNAISPGLHRRLGPPGFT